MTTQTEIDWDTPRVRQHATTARITCRVCELKDDVPLTHVPGPLCRACGVDVVATRAKVKTWLAGVLSQMDAAREEWDHTCRVYRPYWQKIQDARLAERPDADQKARAAHHCYGIVLDAERDLHHALEPLGVERTRLERALTLLDTLSASVALAAGEYVLPAGVDVEACRSCGASIVWGKTPAGKAVPLSLALVEERDGQRVTKTHFVDCPDGRGWKR